MRPTISSLRKIFRDVFSDPDLVVERKTTASDIPDWDSLNHILLVLAIEEEFGVQLAAQEIVGLENVGGFLDLLENKLNPVDIPLIKVIVTDLDNTLWTGVVGEDEITVKDWQADLQLDLLTLQARGILLVASSRNDMDPAIATLADSSISVIGPEHFSLLFIDYESKAENLRKASQHLGLGLDSFLFLDDSPAERALIRDMLPEVTVPEWSDSPRAALSRYLDSGAVTTEEDRKRAQMYGEEADRARLKRDAKTYEEYLAGLELEITLSLAVPDDLDRIHQLTQRSNRFNLTGIRYEREELEKRLSDIYVLRCSDRFGDYGLVGIAVLHGSTKHSWIHIDNLVISCRVLGRGVEEAFFSKLSAEVFGNGISILAATYLASGKNEMVRDFYTKNGMIKTGDDIGLFTMEIAK